MTFSLCMIVKNEEAILGDCLESLKDLMDEIIIVDTGSEDRTKEIAAEYTDKIYDYPWNDNFADARNFAFSKATSDYIYSADADEVIDGKNLEKLRILKETLPEETEVVRMIYINQLFGNTSYDFEEELKPKLFKRLRSFYWEDPIHESIRLSPVIYDSDVRIRHCPTEEHQDRDFALLQNIISREGKLSERLQKLYATELFITGADSDFLDAEAYFKKRLDQDTDEELILIDACVLTKCARLRSDPEALLLAVSRALSSDRTPSEAVFELGEYFRNSRNYREAVKWYREAAFETESLLNRKYHTAYPYIGMHISFVILGDRENAARYAALLRENS